MATKQRTGKVTHTGSWAVSQWWQGLCLDIHTAKLFILALAVVRYCPTSIPSLMLFCSPGSSACSSEVSSSPFFKLTLLAEMPWPAPFMEGHVAQLLQTGSPCSSIRSALATERGFTQCYTLPGTVLVTTPGEGRETQPFWPKEINTVGQCSPGAPAGLVEAWWGLHHPSTCLSAPPASVPLFT